MYKRWLEQTLKDSLNIRRVVILVIPFGEDLFAVPMNNLWD